MTKNGNVNTLMERLLFAVVLASSLLTPFSRDTVVTAVPYIRESLYASEFIASILIGSYSLGRGLGQVMASIPGDRYGSDKIFLAGTILLIASSLLSFYSVEYIDLLIIFHFLQGVGVAAQILSSRVILRHIAKNDAARLAKYFSGKKLVVLASSAFVPTFAVYLIIHYGWESLYLVTALMGLFFALAIFLVTRSLPEIKASPDRASLKSPMQMLSNPKYLGYTAVGMTTYIWTHAYFVGVPLLLRTVFMVGNEIYGYLLSLNMIAAAMGSFITIILLDHLPPKRILFCSILSMLGLATLQLFLAASGYHELNSFVVIIALSSVAVPCITATSMSLALSSFDKHNASRTSALFGFCQYLSGFIGSILAGIVLSAPLDQTLSLLSWLATICCLNLILYCLTSYYSARTT